MPARKLVLASLGETPSTRAKELLAAANLLSFSASMPLRYSAAASKSGAFMLGVLLGDELPIADTLVGMAAAKPISAARTRVARMMNPLSLGWSPKFTTGGEWPQLNLLVQALDLT